MRSRKAPEGFELPATPRTVDFRYAVKAIHWRDEDGRMHEDLIDDRPTSTVGDSLVMRGGATENLLMTPRQMRARQRRAVKRGERITEKQFNLGFKPIEEWDAEELARGRPRNSEGNFRGRPPKYISREIHERALELFKTGIRSDMNALTSNAVGVVRSIMDNDEVDEKGKPIVPAGVKLQAAQWLLEHVVGKPVQPTTSEVSIKLQGILGTVMVNPQTDQKELEGYVPAHTGGRGDIILTPDENGIFGTDPDDEEEEDEEDDSEEG